MSAPDAESAFEDEGSDTFDQDVDSGDDFSDMEDLPVLEATVDEVQAALNTLSADKSRPDALRTPQLSPITDEELYGRVESQRSEADRMAKHLHEDAKMDVWKAHKLHVMIVTSAGKPVYTRYGDTDKLHTDMCVIQAVMAFAEHHKQELLSMQTGGRTFIFVSVGPLHYLAISRTAHHPDVRRRQLAVVHHQLQSVLTNMYQRILHEKPGYDLRNRLEGAEPLLGAIIRRSSYDLAHMVGAVRVLYMPSDLRISLGMALQACRHADVMFAVLAVGNQMMVMPRGKRALPALDALVLLNTIGVVARDGPATFTICLPQFNPRGYLHANVTEPLPGVRLALLTPKKESMHHLEASADEFARSIDNLAHEPRQALDVLIAEPFYLMEEVLAAIPSDTRPLHFMHHKKRSGQLTSPGFGHPLLEKDTQRRLLTIYLNLISRLDENTTEPRTLIVDAFDDMTVLCWATQRFHMLVTFGPETRSSDMTLVVKLLVRWTEANASRLFIQSHPAFV